MNCSLLGLSLLLLLVPAATPAADLLLLDDFEAGLAPGWTEQSFKGHTDYTVVAEGSGHVLRARSQGTASGLVFKHAYDLHESPILTWRWKVAGIVPGGDETRKSGDDYAARIYVVFPHWFFPKTRSINYLWANRLPQGESLPNPFTAQTMMLAVESGAAHAGVWLTERRNVLEDYRQLFGEEPPLVGAIALMTDTDNTGSRAEAWYDEIRIEPGAGR